MHKKANRKLYQKEKRVRERERYSEKEREREGGGKEEVKETLEYLTRGFKKPPGQLCDIR